MKDTRIPHVILQTNIASDLELLQKLALTFLMAKRIPYSMICSVIPDGQQALMDKLVIVGSEAPK